jgi:hypothetical protein
MIFMMTLYRFEIQPERPSKPTIATTAIGKLKLDFQPVSVVANRTLRPFVDWGRPTISGCLRFHRVILFNSSSSPAAQNMILFGHSRRLSVG